MVNTFTIYYFLYKCLYTVHFYTNIKNEYFGEALPHPRLTDSVCIQKGKLQTHSTVSHCCWCWLYLPLSFLYVRSGERAHCRAWKRPCNLLHFFPVNSVNNLKYSIISGHTDKNNTLFKA